MPTAQLIETSKDTGIYKFSRVFSLATWIYLNKTGDSVVVMCGNLT